MDGLVWHETHEGFASAGYRLTRTPGESEWRLLSPGSGTAIRLGRPAEISRHRSSAEAMAWADKLERDEVLRLAARYHFSTAAGSLVALAVFAEVIGSLVGLALVAVALYLVLRSAGNGLGLVLSEAWGWTRLASQRSSLLERAVESLARRRRRSALESGHLPHNSVRPLEPVA